MPKEQLKTYTLMQSATLCGYRRANTMRELHLATDEQRTALGHTYDSSGRVILCAAAVDDLVRRLREERLQRGNWRARNLGSHARPGRQRHCATSGGATRKDGAKTLSGETARMKRDDDAPAAIQLSS